MFFGRALEDTPEYKNDMWMFAQAKHIGTAWRKAAAEVNASPSSQKALEKNKPKYIDIAGGDGHFAEAIAEDYGFDCLVVDVADYSAKIASIDEHLSWGNELLNQNCGRVKFLKADVARVSPDEIIAACYNTAPSFVTATNLVHFLPLKAVDQMFKLVSETVAPGGIFTVFYGTSKDEEMRAQFVNEIRLHDPVAIGDIAQKHGFVAYHEYGDELTYAPTHNPTLMRQGFWLARPPKTNRFCGQPLLLKAAPKG